MSQISVNYPVPGDPNSSEDQKVLTALQTIVNAVNALDNANIAPAAGIEGSKLADTSIAAAKLAANAVEEAKILNGAVTTDKLRDDETTDENRAVTTNHIRNGAVTTAKVAANAVTSDKVSLTTVTGTVVSGVSVSAVNTWTKLNNLSLTLAAGTHLLVGSFFVDIPSNAVPRNAEIQIRDGATVLANGFVEGNAGAEAVIAFPLFAVRTLASAGVIDVYLRSNNGFTIATADSRLIALRIA